ncbi:CBS domain-containing protein [Streptomyces niger]|uniref:CBS domain-containing protein n=1 Tax=Streptomyces niger TaxID=66373 RepID=UPI00069BE9A2|nr:CBS domain-containing protein [Streptomyces niger]
MEIRYAMSSPAVAVPVMASVQDVAKHMQYASVGAVFVVDDDNRLLGMVTDRDLVLRVLAPGLSAQERVESVMTREPVAVTPADDIATVHHVMRRHGIRRVPVVYEGRLMGVVTFEDLFWLAMQGGLTAQGLDDLRDAVDVAREPTSPYRAA